MAEDYSDEELEKIIDRIREWYVKFSKSRHFEGLTKEQKRESDFVIETFAEYMYSYEVLAPEKWDEGGLQSVCLYILPRKISAEESYFRSIAPVLSAFFSFAEEEGLLKNGSDLANKVEKIDKEIVEKASDPRNWGMAKSFFMGAKNAGFDVTSQEEMNLYTALLNLQQAALAEGIDVTNKEELEKFVWEKLMEGLKNIEE